MLDRQFASAPSSLPAAWARDSDSQVAILLAQAGQDVGGTDLLELILTRPAAEPPR